MSNNLVCLFVRFFFLGVSWLSGLRRLTGDVKVDGSSPDTAPISWQDINLHSL